MISWSDESMGSGLLLTTTSDWEVAGSVDISDTTAELSKAGGGALNEENDADDVLVASTGSVLLGDAVVLALLVILKIYNT